jgi:hypothetical protein
MSSINTQSNTQVNTQANTQLAPKVIDTPYRQYSTTYDTHNIINMALTSMISEQLFSVLKSSEGLTFQKIVKLLAITSIDEIRKVLMIGIKKLFSIFGENYVIIFNNINKYIIHNIFITTLYRIVYYIKNKLSPTIHLKDEKINIDYFDTQCEEQINNIVSYDIILEPNFMSSLFNYVNCNKSSTNYILSDRNKITLINNQKLTISEIWTDLTIEYQSTKIYFVKPLQISYNIVHEKAIFDNFNLPLHNTIDIESMETSKREQIITISDLIIISEEKNKFKQQMLILYNKVYQQSNSITKKMGCRSNNMFTFNYLSSRPGHIASNNYTILNFIEYLQNYFENLNAVATFFELIYIIYGQNIAFHDAINNPKTEFLTLFDYKFKLDKKIFWALKTY